MRVQWDPARDLYTRPLAHRSIQIGLSGPAVARYVDDWITEITEVTELAHTIAALVATNRSDEATGLLPTERPYRLPPDVVARVGATPNPA